MIEAMEVALVDKVDIPKLRSEAEKWISGKTQPHRFYGRGMRHALIALGLWEEGKAAGEGSLREDSGAAGENELPWSDGAAADGGLLEDDGAAADGSLPEENKTPTAATRYRRGQLQGLTCSIGKDMSQYEAVAYVLAYFEGVASTGANMVYTADDILELATTLYSCEV